MALEFLRKIYKPSLTVGQVYCKPYGSAAAIVILSPNPGNTPQPFFPSV